MSEIEFSRNFGDLSESTGFQFEFFCASCGDAWRTEFQRYAAGTAGQLLGGAAGVLGGFLGRAADAANVMRDAGYKHAHDKAFEEAIKAAEVHFHRCHKCNAHVCSQCYNPNLHLCTNCAPSVEVESDTAAREKEIEMARASAQAQVEGGHRETDENVVCESCAARVKPGKFCPECGAKMQVKHFCGECGVEISPEVKFCPECGAKQ